jgi:hypothetical protein
MTAPTFLRAATSADGAEVQLTYSENLNAITAPSTAFDVRVDGSQASIAQAVTSGTNVLLSLTSSILPGQSVSVGYSAPANNALATNLAIQNVAGNDAASFGSTTVTNNSTALSTSQLNFSSSSLALGVDSIPNAVAVADFNNDRKPDLVAADAKTSDPRARIFLGNGSGGFAAGGSQAVGALPWSITASDFNSDGNVDVATADNVGQSISVLLGDGTGNLATASTYSAGPIIGISTPRPRQVTSVDLNLDGKTDLVWTVTYGQTVDGRLGVLLNNGSFNPFLNVNPTFYSIGKNPYGLVATDLNRDGKPDLVSANSPNPGDGSISVLLGVGDGTLQQAQQTIVGFKPRYLSNGDYNRDGRQDLALTLSEPENLVQILLGDGTGSFASQTSYSLGTGSGPRDVINKDLNSDGILDLAVSTIYGDSVSVLLGNGHGSFATRKVFPAGDAATMMASGDFDSDGRVDLAVANNNSQNLSVLLNRTPPPTSYFVDNSQASFLDRSPPGVHVQLIDTDLDGLREAVTDKQGFPIDGNRDGYPDANQRDVTGLRLIGDGSFVADYGAISVADGIILRNAHTIIPNVSGRLNISDPFGRTTEASYPINAINSFIGAVSFQVFGFAAGQLLTTTIHLPKGAAENPTIYFGFNHQTNTFERYADHLGNPLYTFLDQNKDGKSDSVQLILSEGDQRWDLDGALNGSIQVSGFAAILNSPSSSLTPVDDMPWLISLLQNL